MDDLHQTIAGVTKAGNEIAMLLRASDFLLTKSCAELQVMAARGNHDGSPEMRRRQIAEVSDQLAASIELGKVAARSAGSAQRVLDEALLRSIAGGKSGDLSVTALNTLEHTTGAFELVAAAVSANQRILSSSIEQLQTCTQGLVPTPEVVAIANDLLQRLASAGRRWPV